MIRKPQNAERASALRRTAEASIEVGGRAGEVARKLALACQAIVAFGLMAIFAFGALAEPTWPRRIFALTIEAIVFSSVYLLGKRFRKTPAKPARGT